MHINPSEHIHLISLQPLLSASLMFLETDLVLSKSMGKEKKLHFSENMHSTFLKSMSFAEGTGYTGSAKVVLFPRRVTNCLD